MKKAILYVSILLTTCIQASAQSVGIGTNAPHSSALLDLSSNTHGLLLPRPDSTQRKAIVSPAAGLLLYQTSPNLLYLYTGTNWQYVPTVLNQTLGITSNAATWNCNLGLNASIILNGDINLTLQNAVAGYIGVLVVMQDATGNRKLVLPAGSKVNGGNEGLLHLPLSLAVPILYRFTTMALRGTGT